MSKQLNTEGSQFVIGIDAAMEKRAEETRKLVDLRRRSRVLVREGLRRKAKAEVEAHNAALAEGEEKKAVPATNMTDEEFAAAVKEATVLAKSLGVAMPGKGIDYSAVGVA